MYGRELSHPNLGYEWRQFTECASPLTAETNEYGNAYWPQSDDYMISQTFDEYKDLQETYVDSFIQNVSALGSTGGLTGDRFAEFHFTDGTNRENNTDTYASEKRGIIMNHVGNGLTFDVDSSTTLRTLKLYTGVYQAPEFQERLFRTA